MLMCDIPKTIGVGFKPQHADAILQHEQQLGFFEIHAENYMGNGGLMHVLLTQLRSHYALSIHGVGLSLGGTDALDRGHLQRLKILCDLYKPAAFSEHLAWSSHGGRFFNDLLPLPYTQRTLAHVIDHVNETQDFLGRQLLLENPSNYLLCADHEMHEVAFLNAIVQRTGCGLLLDVNNVYVCATNHHFDPMSYIMSFPMEAVGEIHLAGHTQDYDDEGGIILIDAHGSEVIDPVWSLYQEVISSTGPLPTLIEWDNDVPAWEVLAQEAARAQGIMHQAAPRQRRNHVMTTSNLAFSGAL